MDAKKQSNHQMHQSDKSGSFQAVFGRHISHAKSEHDLDFDRVLPSQDNEDAQTSLVSLNSTSEVQKITHIFQGNQTGTNACK